LPTVASFAHVATVHRAVVAKEPTKSALTALATGPTGTTLTTLTTKAWSQPTVLHHTVLTIVEYEDAERSTATKSPEASLPKLSTFATTTATATAASGVVGSVTSIGGRAVCGKIGHERGRFAAFAATATATATTGAMCLTGVALSTDARDVKTTDNAGETLQTGSAINTFKAVRSILTVVDGLRWTGLDGIGDFAHAHAPLPAHAGSGTETREAIGARIGKLATRNDDPLAQIDDGCTEFLHLKTAPFATFTTLTTTVTARERPAGARTACAAAVALVNAALPVLAGRTVLASNTGVTIDAVGAIAREDLTAGDHIVGTAGEIDAIDRDATARGIIYPDLQLLDADLRLTNYAQTDESLVGHIIVRGIAMENGGS
jgi:hypothetical protein